VQCFKVTPYSMGEQHFLSIEQIIPTKDVEEFMIGINEKARDEVEGVAEEKNRHRVRREFWAEALPAMNSKSTLFQNISPGTSSWIAAGSGMRGVLFNLVAGRAYARAELYIDRGDRDENKFIFDTLFSKREAIEHAFGMSLNWERLDERRASRIKAEKEGNIFDRNQWPAMIEFMTNAMVKMEATLREPLTELGRVLRSRKEN